MKRFLVYCHFGPRCTRGVCRGIVAPSHEAAEEKIMRSMGLSSKSWNFIITTIQVK